MNWKLIILWRAQGEQSLSFRTQREAEHHRDLMDLHHGQQIVKMEISKQ